jgi:hypothetical protein
MHDGGRLALIAWIGFVLIFVGLTGRLGSILATLIDPGGLFDTSTPGSTTEGAGQNGAN